VTSAYCPVREPPAGCCDQIYGDRRTQGDRADDPGCHCIPKSSRLVRSTTDAGPPTISTTISRQFLST
jgi:hypothetical protein